MKISEIGLVNIIEEYSIKRTPISKLAEQYGVTRHAVYKRLKEAGVDTSKATNGRIELSCTFCGKAFKRPRSYVRKIKRTFCSKDCYFAYIEDQQPGSYKPNRSGQRIARAVVSRYFELKPGHIVHHIDRNTRNNSPTNLMVFANSGDHIRYHRWGAEAEVQPLWSGISS